MKKNTTAIKLRDAINNKKIFVVSGKAFLDDVTRDYPPEQFIEDLEFLCESGYMADMIDFKYEITPVALRVDIGRMCPCGAYIVMQMSIPDCEDPKNIREMLTYEPEETD